MAQEPDWDILNQLQFILMRRMVEPLNAALAAISLLHLEAADDKPREYWQQRANNQVLGVLNLVNAWHALLRYKLGELLPHQHIRPFHVQELLNWLSFHLELDTPLHVESNMVLESSKEALQEALLLLYSAAYTLGPNVGLMVQDMNNGVWFRVRYKRTTGACNQSLEELLDSLSGSWRSEDTAFELRTAADFIALSGSQLHVQGSEQFCEMAFFVYAVGKRPPQPQETAEVTTPPPITTTAAEDIIDSMLPNLSDSDRTDQLPESDLDRR